MDEAYPRAPIAMNEPSPPGLPSENDPAVARSIRQGLAYTGGFLVHVEQRIRLLEAPEDLDVGAFELVLVKPIQFGDQGISVSTRSGLRDLGDGRASDGRSVPGKCSGRSRCRMCATELTKSRCVPMLGYQTAPLRVHRHFGFRR